MSVIRKVTEPGRMEPSFGSLVVMFVLSDLRGDGAQRSTVQLATQLQRLGHRPSIVVLTDRSPSLIPEASESGVDVHVLSSKRLRHQIPELHRLIISMQPDIVHTALWNADIAGRLASFRAHTRVVSSFVNSPNDAWEFWPARRRSSRGEAKRALDALTAHLFVDRFHAISTGAARANERALWVKRSHVTVVERGRDPELLGTRTDERRARVRAAIDVGLGRPLILASGRGDREKGHDVLIDALPVIRRTEPDALIVIAGRAGSGSEGLRSKVRRLDLGEQVRFLGHRSDLADLMAAADVFVMPSFFEGGIATGSEALAIGTPLVMSRLPAVEGLLVDGRHALLVEPGDSAGLAASILSVLGKPGAAEDRAAEGRRLFAERLSLDVCTNRMVALYETVLDG